MKIAFVAGDDLTENPRIVRQARALAAAGHRVTAYGVLSPTTEEEDEAAGVVQVRVPLKDWRARGGGLRGPMRLARWFERFRPVAELAASREKPEAIHAADLDVALPAQDAAVALGVPFVLDVAGAAYVDRLEETVASGAAGLARVARPAAIRHLRRAGDALERKLRRRGLTAVVADTESLADDLERRYGGPRPFVVRSCAPLRGTAAKDDALRRKVGAHPTDRLVLFIGPPTAGCGVDAAIRALRLLGDRRLLVVTDAAPGFSKFETLAEEVGVSAQVRLVPPTSEAETARLVASADVAVVPTEPNTAANRLGVPLRFYDALAAGLPVVASDTPEVGAIVRRTGAGVLYPARSPQDPAALAEGVHTLLEDSALAATCAESARRAAAAEFNWDLEGRYVVDLYDEVDKRR